ncbi:NAD(P)H-dependent oxidoreductase [Allokutzneria sp. A3M-2-11 16]|uniref:flavodoxin family protein n=1 Tax=Allokutzneria sp. A3M-2-11 16 TaxID=2962043 RepID=UPI0020B8C69A|nr:NAD(P)H-dependent oxidoreductase [Allokutzneria sp. A3M-2-11 16]MCP3804775.1 NAD(P)H-dependent oxidoreductase [Allokutzneria sp. A3M-2-11 16]
MTLRALVLNCTLKKSPAESNTEQLASVVVTELEKLGVAVEELRLVDLGIPPGVDTDLGAGDPWPAVHDKLLSSEILVFATPTWVGHPSSIAQLALERMDAMISETDDEERPVAYNRVAGVVVTGNEDGAHHVISELAGGLGDIGYTIPGQAWTYWNRGPGPGPSYADTGSDTDDGKDWSHSTGRAMAGNLVAVAAALRDQPIPPPRS